jgi:hypothetical protein
MVQGGCTGPIWVVGQFGLSDGGACGIAQRRHRNLRLGRHFVLPQAPDKIKLAHYPDLMNLAAFGGIYKITVRLPSGTRRGSFWFRCGDLERWLSGRKRRFAKAFLY